MPDFDVQQVVEAAAKAIHDARCGFHREGVTLVGHYAVQQSADDSAALAMSVILPAVTQQIRALHVLLGDPDDWRWCDGCEQYIEPNGQCPTVRLLDSLDAAVRAES